VSLCWRTFSLELHLYGYHRKDLESINIDLAKKLQVTCDHDIAPLAGGCEAAVEGRLHIRRGPTPHAHLPGTLHAQVSVN